ncbi:hypothetical protein [Pseudoalteromonas xiamenensis]|uniref:Uncharacterized protein n=1 Tax=Pseudoalteromonas xiamenensis TaxID=882626 RepID=A0A975DJ86_9GAMM|nr:hypothetical protein [Pseudoalteromonas xiamenensis]QTH72783.1 hypothetical protein J5O05_08460 [Pseudoalteromonas xiamenensis]
MKMNYIVAAFAVAFSGNTLAKDLDLSAMERDVSIFENVLESALQHDVGKSIRDVKGFYLKHQGIVFNVNVKTGNRWFSRFSDDSGDGAMAFMSLDPESLDAIAEHLGNFGEDLADASREAYHQTMENVRLQAEEVRRSAEQERELSREIRELERERRELGFAKGLEDKDEKAETEQRLKELEAKIKTLQSQQETLAAEQKELKRTMADQKAKQASQKQEAQAATQEKLDQALSKSLCDYGAGLKTLPENEHVSFIVTGLTGSGKQVHVYTKDDIQACVSGKFSVAKLREKVERYTF